MVSRNNFHATSDVVFICVARFSHARLGSPSRGPGSPPAWPGRCPRPEQHLKGFNPELLQGLVFVNRKVPSGLRVAMGKPTREQVRRPKLPVEIHGERVFVDDEGTWYAASSVAAAHLQDVLNGPPGSGGGPLALEMAEAYARAVIRKLGGGRLLFTPNATAS